MSINFNQLIMEDALNDIAEEDRVLNELDGMQAGPPKSPKAKKIVFNYELDITLLTEVTALNPFSETEKWAEVSANVTEQYRAISKDESFLISTRGCKDRVSLLLKQLDKKDETKLKRGCTPDLYENKLTLIEGIQVLQSTAGAQITKKAKVLVNASNSDKSKGEAIRKAAMTTHEKRKAQTEDESDGSEAHIETKKAKVMQSRKKDPVLDFIESKRVDEKIIAERKLTLEERRLVLEEKRLEAERLERDRFYENEAEKQKLKSEKLKNEAREKELLFDLLKDLKK